MFSRVSAIVIMMALLLTSVDLSAYSDEITMSPEEETVPDENDIISEADETLLENENDSESGEGETFIKTCEVDGVIITVTADNGVFPDDATVVARVVDEKEKQEADEAVESVRDYAAHVARSYTYDITIYDADGNEIEPDTDKGTVKVSFAMAEAANSNLETNVYHIEENDGEYVTEELNVEDGDANVITVETDGFSYYTVEFTYNNLQYVLVGGTRTELSNVLDYVGLSGEVTDAQSSNEDLFKAYNENGVWYVEAVNAFTSYETLTLMIDGINYVIDVTDAAGGSRHDFSYDSSNAFFDWKDLTVLFEGDKISNISAKAWYNGDSYSISGRKYGFFIVDVNDDHYLDPSCQNGSNFNIAAGDVAPIFATGIKIESGNTPSTWEWMSVSVDKEALKDCSINNKYRIYIYTQQSNGSVSFESCMGTMSPITIEKYVNSLADINAYTLKDTVHTMSVLGGVLGVASQKYYDAEIDLVKSNEDVPATEGMIYKLYFNWPNHTEHTWIYTAKDNEVLANCESPFCTEYHDEDKALKLILRAENTAYTGSPYNKATISNAIKDKTGATAGTIYYEGVAPTVYTKSTTAPTIYGTYKASVEIGGKTAEKVFEISPVSGDIIYVSASGDDTNPGTVNAPVATLATAYSKVNANNGTIALLSDITAPSGAGQILTANENKTVVITSAKSDGTVLSNPAGDYSGVYYIRRGGNTDSLFNVYNGSVTFRDVIVDGGNQIFTVVNRDSNNQTTFSNGALVFIKEGSVVLDTNVIFQNNDNRGNGGISECGAFVLRGNTSVLTLQSNATIRNNKAPRHGGAGTLYDKSKLILKDDAKMTGNGVFFEGYSKGYYGGGTILACSGTTVEMSGNVEISNNRVDLGNTNLPNTTYISAVQLQGNAFLYVQDNVRIFDNYAFNAKDGSGNVIPDNTQSNLYMDTTYYLYITGSLGSNAKIGVSLPGKGDNTEFTTVSSYELTDNDASKVFEDTNTYYVGVSTNKKLQLNSGLTAVTVNGKANKCDKYEMTVSPNTAIEKNDISLIVNGVKQNSSDYSVSYNAGFLTINYDNLNLKQNDAVIIQINKNHYKINNGQQLRYTYAHDIMITANDNKISAKCTKDDCSKNSDGAFGTLVINASDKEYDGSTNAIASETEDLTTKLGGTVGSIYYVGTNGTLYSDTTDVPTEIGSYKTYIKYTYDSTDYTAEKQFSIKKKPTPSPTPNPEPDPEPSGGDDGDDPSPAPELPKTAETGIVVTNYVDNGVNSVSKQPQPYVSSDTSKVGWTSIKQVLNEYKKSKKASKVPFSVTMNGYATVDNTLLYSAAEQKIDLAFILDNGVQVTVPKENKVIKNATGDVYFRLQAITTLDARKNRMGNAGLDIKDIRAIGGDENTPVVKVVTSNTDIRTLKNRMILITFDTTKMTAGYKPGDIVWIYNGSYKDGVGCCVSAKVGKDGKVSFWVPMINSYWTIGKKNLGEKITKK